MVPALNEKLSSFAWKLTELDPQTATKDDLRLIAEGIFSDGAHEVIVETIMQSWDALQYEKVLEIAWNLICQGPLPFFEHLDNAKQDMPPSDSRIRLSVFWKETLSLLAIWKLPIRVNRPSCRSIIALPKDGDAYWDGIGCDEAQRDRIRAAWCSGRDWMDKKASESSWCFKNPYTDQTKKSISTQDLAMWIFVRSHLAWDGGSLSAPVPVSAIHKLLEVGDSSGWWADDPESEDNSPDRAPSLRATAMAVSGLADWAMSVDYVLDASNPDWDCTPDLRALLHGKEYEDLLKVVKERCSKALSFLMDHYIQGGWSGRVSGYMPDIRATSHTVYILDRFSTFLGFPKPSREIGEAAKWLIGSVNRILTQTCNPNEEMTQDMALAVTVLAAEKGAVDSALWLRRVLQWLLPANIGKKTVCPNPGDLLDTVDTWRLYAAIEMIRREDIRERVSRIV